jgi:hypothetical protein
VQLDPLLFKHWWRAIGGGDFRSNSKAKQVVATCLTWFHDAVMDAVEERKGRRA